MKFDEVDILTTLSRYSPKLSGLVFLIRPTQEMIDFVAKEQANAKNRDPPYVPYVDVKISGAPRVHSSSDHSSALPGG